MKISELLYRLQKKNSLNSIEESQTKDLLRQKPYLQTLDVNRSFSSPPLHSIEDKFSALSHLEFVSNLKEEIDTIPFRKNDTIHSTPSNPLSSSILTNEELKEEIEINIPILFESTPPVITSASEPKRPLYLTIESDFVKYLSTLPICQVKYENKNSVATEENLVSETKETHEILQIDQDEKQAVTDNLIKKSVVLPEGLKSESLANLWALQGKINLAILMYKRLGAENPEKNATFAAKIEKLKAENLI